jgi:hypothetical protein
MANRFAHTVAVHLDSPQRNPEPADLSGPATRKAFHEALE